MNNTCIQYILQHLFCIVEGIFLLLSFDASEDKKNHLESFQCYAPPSPSPRDWWDGDENL